MLRLRGLTVSDLAAPIALCWALVQLWHASGQALGLGWLHMGETQARSIHLAFSLLLVFLLFSIHGRRRDDRPGLAALATGLLAAFCAGYLFLFYDRISAHLGDPDQLDLVVAATGMLLLLEATRRTLGAGMVILASVLLAYVFFGHFAPDLIAHKGASLGKAMSHLWLTTEGVFGIALGVSASFIFLFVLFGALLDVAGGSAWLVRSMVALVGHLRGGPAKAAVFVSAATGLVSGSSITNVVTTGPITIPLVKRVGYPPEKAAAIEVTSSVNGQMMPPVMGAAAFLMVEFTGVPYVDVLKHALISAVVSYAGLLYIVHLEAVKSDLRGLPGPPFRMLGALAGLLRGIVIFMGAVIAIGFFTRFVRLMAPDAGGLVVAAVMLITYLLLLRIGLPYAATLAQADVRMTTRPALAPTLKSGLFFMLPVGLLVWCLTVERLSPTASAFWAIAMLGFIVLTRHALSAWMRGDRSEEVVSALRQGGTDLYRGLTNGALNMVPVAVGTATAGIVIGSFTLTGVGLTMTDLVDVLSGGNVFIMLVMVACVCLILGSGLTTTTSYIIVSTLMVPVIVNVGAQNGLFVPLIAAHLFVFYFGLLADILPPAGLATHAAASIAGANPVRTGIVSFRYSLRMVLLPFMFIFNPQLLLIGLSGWPHALLTVVAAMLAGFIFISVNQGWLLVRSATSERLVLLLATFMLFNPAMFMDRLYEPYREVQGEVAAQAIADAPSRSRLRVRFSGETLEGREVTRGVLLPLGMAASSMQVRLANIGIDVEPDGDGWLVTAVRFGSQAHKLGIESGFRMDSVDLPVDRPASEWFFVPALALVGWVVFRQRRRKVAQEALGA